MTLRSPQIATTGGIEVTFNALATTGDTFYPAKGRVVAIRNTTAGAINAVFETPGTVDGNLVDDKVVSIPANATRYFGYGDAIGYLQTDGTVKVSAAAAGLELGIVQG